MAEDSDSLASLEERITRAVQMVRTLKEENADLRKKLDAAGADRDAAIADLAKLKQSHAESEKVRTELESLKSERKHVRNRIEKLLGQMDLLSGQ